MSEAGPSGGSVERNSEGEEPEEEEGDVSIMQSNLYILVTV